MERRGPHGYHGWRHHARALRARDSAAFRLMLGEDYGLRVRCGEEPLAACVEAIRPLIDRLNPRPGDDDNRRRFRDDD